MPDESPMPGSPGFSSGSDSGSSPTLFCQGSFSAESSEPGAFGEHPWKVLSSPGLTSAVDDGCCASLLDQGTTNASRSDELAAFSGVEGIWTSSGGSKKMARLAFMDVLGISNPVVLRTLESPMRSQVRPRRLLGWGDTSHLDQPMLGVVDSPCQDGSSPSAEVVDPIVLHAPLQRTTRGSSVAVESEAECGSGSCDSGDDVDWEEDGDEYEPSVSRSPSLKSAVRVVDETTLVLARVTDRSLKRGRAGGAGAVGKGKKKKKKDEVGGGRTTTTKGSAALALAVVTHIGEVKREGGDSVEFKFDPVRVYREGGYVVRKRKNQPIPVPVPVPNLNKKSRGRKVPFVAADGESPGVGLEMPDSPRLGECGGGGGGRVKMAGGRGRKKVQSAEVFGAGRSFVCVVPGCGKCFVRGEHLKRHVRSIHTNDKRKCFFRFFLFFFGLDGWLLILFSLVSPCVPF